jgi:hypothetical protein
MIKYDNTILEHREALAKTAEYYRDNAIGIREEDLYADHVSEDQKDEYLANSLQFAKEVSRGEHLGCFAVAQKFHFFLTGDSVALLP